MKPVFENTQVDVCNRVEVARDFTRIDDLIASGGNLINSLRASNVGQSVFSSEAETQCRVVNVGNSEQFKLL